MSGLKIWQIHIVYYFKCFRTEPLSKTVDRRAVEMLKDLARNGSDEAGHTLLRISNHPFTHPLVRDMVVGCTLAGSGA